MKTGIEYSDGFIGLRTWAEHSVRAGEVCPDAAASVFGWAKRGAIMNHKITLHQTGDKIAVCLSRADGTHRREVCRVEGKTHAEIRQILGGDGVHADRGVFAPYPDWPSPTTREGRENAIRARLCGYLTQGRSIIVGGYGNEQVQS